jgi:hypothetical protein
LQNDFVAIHFGAASRRSLDLNGCRVAVNSLDVNAAINRSHLNTRPGSESEASVDFIALLIKGRPNGQRGRRKNQ